MYTTKPLSSFQYKLSEEYGNFKHNLSKVALLLTTSDKCKENTITFETPDLHLYSDLKKTIYSCDPEVQYTEMKDDFYQILIEQSIVLVITSWECYFSDVIEKIFNGDAFIQTIYNDTTTFEAFLKEFNISKKRFADLLTQNNNNFSNLMFGTFLIENKKVSCQRLKDVTYIFEKYFNYIDLKNIGNINWGDIEALFASRHSIIHNQDEDILSTYDKNKVVIISRNVSEIVGYVDKNLFTSYNGQILEFS